MPNISMKFFKAFWESKTRYFLNLEKARINLCTSFFIYGLNCAFGGHGVTFTMELEVSMKWASKVKCVT